MHIYVSCFEWYYYTVYWYLSRKTFKNAIVSVMKFDTLQSTLNYKNLILMFNQYIS